MQLYRTGRGPVAPLRRLARERGLPRGILAASRNESRSRPGYADGLVYHYTRDGREIGPVAAEKLADLLETGVLAPEDLVRIDGTAARRAAREVVATLARPRAQDQVSAPPPVLAVPGRTRVFGTPNALVLGTPAEHPEVPAAVPLDVGMGGLVSEPAPPPAPTLIGPHHGGTAREPASDIPPTLDVVGHLPPARSGDVIDVGPPTTSDVPPTLEAAGARKSPVRLAERAVGHPAPERRLAAPAPGADSPPSSRTAFSATALVRSKAALLVLLAAGAAVAGALLLVRYSAVLRGPLPRSGSVLRTESHLTLGAARVLLKRGANAMTGTVSLRAATEQALEVRSETSIALSVPKETLERTLTFSGQPTVTATHHGELHGRTVLIDGPPSRRQKSLLGAEPTAREQRRLDRLLAEPDTWYPIARVWPGRSWTVDPRWLCGTLALEADCTGTVSMHLARFVRYRGERTAHLTFSGTVRGTRDKIRFDLSATGDVYRSLERFFDVERRATGSLHALGEILAGKDGSALIEFDGPIELLEQTALEGP